MWAADGGIKWSGLAVNAQYFMRWQVISSPGR